jgi:hypothetical protein
MRAHGGELRARRRQRREKLDAERREAAVRETAEIRARARARVFGPETRRNMPAPALPHSGHVTESLGDDRDASLAGAISGTGTGTRVSREGDDAFVNLTPSEALAREAFGNAEGPRGASFARVAGLGFASGLDAPGLPEGGLEGDAFGPALAPGPAATAGTWGPRGPHGRGEWGPGAEDALAAAAAAAAEAPGKKKGKKKGVVLSLTSGGGRRY